MILLEDLCVRAGSFGIDHINFEIRTGEYAILMGPTGCGKTTVLETICGLKPAAGGRILLGGRDVTRSKPAERGIGYVPQDCALFGTMTVREHLAFALEIRRWSRSATKARVEELARMLGIEALLDRRPKGLSGGESQRVALGRALSFRPMVLCLDEPLCALDDKTREGLYEMLEAVRAQTGVTTIHVTHSRAEAERLGDRTIEL